ncbi:hypothetical protein [Kitasatospora herbaricolor]|uniref:Uncharacterized protein n=1 Tax=Kitasatospora herbaricolor TaxID=68217 RepID=A0ABZ1WAT9_9ACTN|nr:hypothetical protein [Kitasatospora herbaricolor]
MRQQRLAVPVDVRRAESLRRPRGALPYSDGFPSAWPREDVARLLPWRGAVVPFVLLVLLVLLVLSVVPALLVVRAVLVRPALLGVFSPLGYEDVWRGSGLQVGSEFLRDFLRSFRPAA